MLNRSRVAMLLGTAVAAPFSPLQAQPTSAAGRVATQGTDTQQASQNPEEEEEVVVTGQRPRGSVVGDIQPENVLRSRDVKATGATNFDELLVAIAPEIGVARASGAARPLVLLNGRRISSYRELRDIPIEAISRVDILPEEVALKYGYPPDQKVVNVVLKNRFKETVAQGAVNTASHEGFTGGGGDLTKIQLGKDRRTTINLHAGSDNILRGSQRSLLEQQYESTGTGAIGLLLPPEVGLRGTVTYNRALPGGVDATLNAEAAHIRGHALSGLSEQLPAELNRNSTDDSLHLGGTLAGDKQQWHWSLASNADVDRSNTTTSRLGQFFAPGSAESTHAAATLDGTVNGPLFALAAGTANVTLRVAGAAEHLHIDQENFVTPPAGSTNRTSAI